MIGQRKYKSLVKTAEDQRWWDRLPTATIQQLTTAQLRIVMHCLAASYSDGYEAGSDVFMADHGRYCDSSGQHTRNVFDEERRVG